METTKTTKEALQLLGRYYGKEAHCTWKDGTNAIYDIDHVFLRNISCGAYKSFRFTSLRSLDEMTEEESAIYYLISQRYFELRIDALQYESERTHYLESIGIDTMDLKDKTIFIKD